jgi:hypothetical protein
MKMWEGNGNNITLLLFYLKGLEVLHKKRRGQVKTIVMEHFQKACSYTSPDLLTSSIPLTH